MSYPSIAPPHWPTFRHAVKAEAPGFPLVPSGVGAVRVDRANQAVALITTILTAAGVHVPDNLGRASAAAGVRGAADLGHAVVDEAAGQSVGALMGPAAGFAPGAIVSNGIAVLRGAVQAVGRSDEMEEYLEQIVAYVQTLARTAIGATRDAQPYAHLPEPMIPQDVESSGGAYNARLRGGYRRGYQRVAAVIRTLDGLRDPTQHDWNSKQCFTHLYMQGNPNLTQSQEARYSFRIRRRLEAYITADLLNRSLLEERERLRRWAMTGSDPG